MRYCFRFDFVYIFFEIAIVIRLMSLAEHNVMILSHYLHQQSILWQCKLPRRHMRVLLPLLCRHHLRSSQAIGSHLSEEEINSIGNQSRKPDLQSIVMTMRKTKILVDDVPLLRYLFVPFYLVLCQFCRGHILSHDTISDLVQIKKIPVCFSEIPFIGIHLFNRFFRMTTAGDKKRKIRTVIMGGRIYLGRKHKPIPGIIFHRSVGFKIRNILKWFPLFNQFSLGRFSFLFFLPSTYL